MPVPAPDDRDVGRMVSEAVEGGSDAFAELLAPFRAPLFGYLLRSCGRRDLAEDLLQETLLRCWLALPGYDERGRFRAWLFSIARNTVRDAVRRLARSRLVDPEEMVHLHPGPAEKFDPHRAMESRQLLRRVQRLLAHLPERQRDVFLLRHHGGMTFREIAGLLGVPLGTVLSDMHRTVGKIRKEIGRHDER